MERRGLLLLLGADRPRKLQHIQELEQSLGVGPLDRHALDGAGVSSAELIALSRQRPALGAARLIIVDHAQRLDAQTVSGLLQHAEAIAQTACVVLLIERELGVRHPLARAAHDGVVTVKRFAGGGGPTVKPFALVDALGARDVAGCLQAVRDQRILGKEPPEIVGLVTWQVQRWVMVRHLLDGGYAPQRIASVAGMRAWQVERLQTEVSGRTLGSLRQALARCWQLDAEIKRGRTLPWLALEQFVVELCHGRGP